MPLREFLKSLPDEANWRVRLREVDILRRWGNYASGGIGRRAVLETVGWRQHPELLRADPAMTVVGAGLRYARGREGGAVRPPYRDAAPRRARRLGARWTYLGPMRRVRANAWRTLQIEDAAEGMAAGSGLQFSWAGRRNCGEVWRDLGFIARPGRDDTDGGASPETRTHAPAIRAWYHLRIEAWPRDAAPPTEAEDLAAAREHFAGTISRNRFREIRRGMAPKVGGNPVPVIRKSR